MLPNLVKLKEFLKGKLRKYHSRYLSFYNYVSKTNHWTTASFQISLCKARHGKHLSDGDFIKMAMTSASNSFFHDVPPDKDEIIQSISEMPLGRITVKDWVLHVAGDVSHQLTTDLRKAACYSLCLYEAQTYGIMQASSNFALYCWWHHRRRAGGTDVCLEYKGQTSTVLQCL